MNAIGNNSKNGYNDFRLKNKEAPNNIFSLDEFYFVKMIKFYETFYDFRYENFYLLTKSKAIVCY